jgi:glycerophosphoryl diester phosphodiesterase
MRAMRHVRIGLVVALSAIALAGPVAPAESADSVAARALKACERPILTSHMGSLPDGDGNTLPAYLGAVTRGAESIEMDVRRTRDAKFVMFHNPTVGSTTNGTGEIARMTLAQVQKLRTTRSHNRIPTLGETMAALAPHDIRLQIELKDAQLWPRGAIPRIIDMVRHYRLGKRVVIESDDARIVHRVHVHWPAIEDSWKSLRQPWSPRSAAEFTDGVVLNRQTHTWRNVHRLHRLGLKAYSPRIRDVWGWILVEKYHTDTVMTFDLKAYIEWCARQH